MDGTLTERPTDDVSEYVENPERLHERVLVLRAQLGDRAAFHELVDCYQERLTYYVQRMVSDWHQSRDILQQVWLEVFQKIAKLNSPAAFRVWLYRVAHDRVVTLFRRQRVETDARERVAINTAETERWNELELLENAELVHVAIEKLSVVHREIMTLRFLEEMDVAEIARVLQCSEGTVKSRLHYAKAAMRRFIDEERGHG
jgi:RNA polymerase sigma-70 factor, ECF subfamily